MVTIRRDDDGTPTVWADPCIAPLVAALNDAGLPTIASCCGHGALVPSVVLDDGRVVAVLADLAALDALVPAELDPTRRPGFWHNVLAHPLLWAVPFRPRWWPERWGWPDPQRFHDATPESVPRRRVADG